MTAQNWLQPTDDFIHRHLGPTRADIQEMLAALGLLSLETLADTAIPPDLRFHRSLDVPAGDGVRPPGGRVGGDPGAVPARRIVLPRRAF